MKIIQLIALLFVILDCCTFSDALTIDTVPIGNPGNIRYSSSYTGLVGSVAYSFRMARTEITNAQYVKFLNAVAASDPYYLYYEGMTNDPVGGIVRNGVDGSYSYSVKPPAIGQGPGGADYTYDQKPVVYIGVVDALRFVNWLHNGQGGPETTEAGAYTLLGAVRLPTGSYTTGIKRNPDARWWLPSFNEWFKAAYFDPNLQTQGWYHRYATGNDVYPNNNLPPADSGNSANFPINGVPAAGNYSYPFTDVGAYTLSRSFYQTLDQTGNVKELTDTWYQDSHNLSGPIFRGGSWSDNRIALDWERSTALAGGRDNDIGFRVATLIPEPSTVLLGSLGLLTLLLRPRSRQVKRVCGAAFFTRGPTGKSFPASLLFLVTVGIAANTLAPATHTANAAVVTFKNGAPTPLIGGTYAGTEDTTLLINNNIHIRAGQDLNFGGDEFVRVGEANYDIADIPRTSLMRFDLSPLAGRYSEINSVTLRLYLYYVSGGYTDSVSLFRLSEANKNWVEGNRVDNGNDNSPISYGLSTREQRIQGSQNWAGSSGAETAGVDYLTPQIASHAYNNTIAQGTAFDFNFSDVAFVSNWIAGDNPGLFLTTDRRIYLRFQADEEIAFYSSEASQQERRPELIVDYMPVPTPPEPQVSIHFDPRATYLKPVHPDEQVANVQDAKKVNLSTDLGFSVASGDYLRIQAIGEFQFAGSATTGGPFGDGTLRDAIGIFSSSASLGPKSDADRVPDKKEVVAGNFQAVVSDPQNDIPYDFFIPRASNFPGGAIVRVPNEAAYLFLGAADTAWFDNSDPDGNYGVRITRINPARLVGDYNFNGAVDAGDYVVWRKASGLLTTDSPADGDLDGDVDANDYNIWRSHFGQSIPTSGSALPSGNAVPEPANESLFLVGCAILMPRMRRQFFA